VVFDTLDSGGDAAREIGELQDRLGMARGHPDTRDKWELFSRIAPTGRL
jgi:hypothetical protein